MMEQDEQHGGFGMKGVWIGAAATIIAAVIGGLFAVFGGGGGGGGESGGGGGFDPPITPEDASISVAFSEDVVNWHEITGGQTTVDLWVEEVHVGELCTCREVFKIDHELSEGPHGYRLEGTISNGQYENPIDGSGTIQAQDGRDFDISFGDDRNDDGWPDEMELDPLE